MSAIAAEASHLGDSGRQVAEVGARADRDEAPTDAELLGRWQRGEAVAYTALIRRWEDPAYRIARRVTGEDAAAEDIRQTVFLKLCQKPNAVRVPDSFGAWLRTTVVREAISYLRSERRRQRREDVRRRQTNPHPQDATPPGADAEERERLDAALQCLDAEDRALLALRFDENLSYRQLAEILERPSSTVKSCVDRLVSRLRRLMKESHP